jgi:hypothetical protein
MNISNIDTTYGRYTLKDELQRTSEMAVELAATQGVYYAFALLYDTQRQLDKQFLAILEEVEGAIKKKK